MTKGVDFITPRLIAYPVPVYPAEWSKRDGVQRKRWAGVTPEWMWHPMMWLPEILQPREGENEDTYAIRLALELTESGVYLLR